MLVKLLADDPPHLGISGVIVQVTVQSKKTATDQPWESGRESCDGIDYVAESTPRRCINDSSRISNGKLIKAMNDRTKEPPTMWQGKKARQFEQLAFELDRDHGC